MKTFWIFLLLAVGLTTVQAQEQQPTLYKHSIGIGAGFTTAYGLSYRYTPSRWGVQANFAPFKNENFSSISAGLTVLYKLIPGEVANLYLYQGNHFYHSQTTDYFIDPAKTIFSSDKTDYKTVTSESFFNNGAGFCIELIFAKQVGFNLMAGYAMYDNFVDYNLTGEVALYFKF